MFAILQHDVLSKTVLPCFLVFPTYACMQNTVCMLLCTLLAVNTRHRRHSETNCCNAPLQYPSLFVRTTFFMTFCRKCMNSKIFCAESFVALKLLRNSSSVGRLSLQIIGVCTAVMSSWPKSAGKQGLWQSPKLGKSSVF